MEPVSLATAVVALLVPFVKGTVAKLADRAGERVADATVDASRQLYERVRARLSGDAYNEQQLAGVQADPDSPVRRRNLEATLAELFVRDADFADEVARLVEQGAAGGGVSVHATDTGVAAGGNVTMTAGGDAVGRDKVGYPPGKR